MSNIFDELERRGMVEQATDKEKIRELFGRESVRFYIGFDATADSLHAGSFIQLSIMRMLQKAGHHPIPLLGGGTTTVGDPTGRTDMRLMMSDETINNNIECFKKQMMKFFDLSEDKVTFVNNADWLKELNYISFLREIGVHFSINRMLAADAFKTRMERGLSFFELNYMIMQSYDFLHLFRTHGCIMQFGGNDQWSNIISGVDLIRRVEGKEAYGLTFKLLTTKDGVKMGKTAKGALWLDREKTSPYEFYQYWRNIPDEEVINCLKLLTEIPMSEIDRFETLRGEEFNAIKELLAFTLTETVHSTEDAVSSRQASKALFAGSGDSGGMPSTELFDNDFSEGGIEILELLIKCGLASSKGEGRRLISQGGISIDDKKIDDMFYIVDEVSIKNGVIIKKGKKAHHRAYMA